MTRLAAVVAAVALLLPATAGAVTFTSDATITNHDYGTEQVIVTNGAKVTFDNVTWGAYRVNNSYEGRLTVLGAGSTATVTNSLFHGGGCSDGIQLLGSSPANYGTAIVTNTEFTGLVQDGCDAVAHVDPIQLYGGNLTVRDSYFHANTTGIMSPDSAGILTATNNVFIGRPQYASAFCLGGMQNASIAHNYVSSDWSIALNCTNGGTSANNTIRNNVANVVGYNSTNTVDHNVRTATTAGGTGRCAYATPNAGAATDGTVIGLNDCSTGPPPPVDHQPVGAFSFSPAAPVVGQDVIFDVSSSTCEDAPCTYALTDEPGAWPVKSGPGPTLTFAFQQAGTKHVNLRVTDADGDVSAAVAHDVVVSDTPPPPPPGGCDQACEDAYKATIAARDQTITDLNAQLADVQALADSRLAMIQDRDATITTLQGLIAHIHEETAP